MSLRDNGKRREPVIAGLRELLAKHAHSMWSGWMCYLFRFGVQNDDGTFTMDADKVKRWRRQMETDYEDLPEHEKESDLKEADGIIEVVESRRRQYISQLYPKEIPNTP